jgi:hypothetical protein
LSARFHRCAGCETDLQILKTFSQELRRKLCQNGSGAEAIQSANRRPYDVEKERGPFIPIGQRAVTCVVTRKAAKTWGKTGKTAVGSEVKILQNFFRGATPW